MEKRERKVVPGRGKEVGTCVVYFGSYDSLGMLEWVGNEIRHEAGKLPRARLGRTLNASLKSFKFTRRAGTILSA